MSDELYFVISGSEDGDAYFQAFKTAEEIKKWHEWDWDGEQLVEYPEFLKKPPQEMNIPEWGNSVLIIKGRVVCPKPVKTVVKWEIE